VTSAAAATAAAPKSQRAREARRKSVLAFLPSSLGVMEPSPRSRPLAQSNVRRQDCQSLHGIRATNGTAR